MLYDPAIPKQLPETPLPAQNKKRCMECGNELPLTDFKPNQLMPDGYGKRCNGCLRVARTAKSEAYASEKKKRNAIELQEKLILTTAPPTPEEGEFLGMLLAGMGGAHATAKMFVEDYMGSEPGTGSARRFQEMIVNMLKRETDRKKDSNDIRNMTTDQIQEELKRSMRKLIDQANVIPINGKTGT